MVLTWFLERSSVYVTVLITVGFFYVFIGQQGLATFCILSNKLYYSTYSLSVAGFLHPETLWLLYSLQISAERAA